MTQNNPPACHPKELQRRLLGRASRALLCWQRQSACCARECSLTWTNRDMKSISRISSRNPLQAEATHAHILPLSEHLHKMINVNAMCLNNKLFSYKYSWTNLCLSWQSSFRSASISRAKSEPASPGCEDGEDGLHQGLWGPCDWSASGSHPTHLKMAFCGIAVVSAMPLENATTQQEQPKEGPNRLL